MAGDWLKFDKATPDKPEVFAIATELNIDPDAVVGKLMRVWSWFDSHTESGNAPSVTSALLDRIAGVSGFVTSMQKTGWIVVYEGGISLPNFARHCGETAKKRAQNNSRVSKHRNGIDNANNELSECNAPSVTSALQKHVPEKRREEKNKEPKTKGRVAPFVLPEQIKAEVWKDWHDYRNSKKGWTAKARQLSLNTLLSLAAKGHDPQTIINTSIERGWTGLFEPKTDPKPNVVRPIATKRAPETPEQAAIRQREANAAFERYQRDLGAA